MPEKIHSLLNTVPAAGVLLIVLSALGWGIGKQMFSIQLFGHQFEADKHQHPVRYSIVSLVYVAIAAICIRMLFQNSQGA